MRNAFLSTIFLIGGGYGAGCLFLASNATQQNQPTHQSSMVPKEQKPVDATAQTIKVDFQDSQPLIMTWTTGSKYHVSFFVRNDEDVDTNLTFVAVLVDNDKKVLRVSPQIVSNQEEVPKNGFENIVIELDAQNYAVPLFGYLEMTANCNLKDRKPVHQYRSLRVPPALPSDLATRFFQWGLFVSAGVVLISILVLAWQKKLAQRMGPPSWNFGDSWGTNITVGGAILTTLLGFSALPEQTHYLNKIAYLCLSLIFSALITIAPSIFALVRTPVVIPGSDIPQFQGYVVPFAIASGVTLWGALGQIGTVGLLFLELLASHAISQTVLDSLVVLLALVAILLVIYALRTIIQIPSKHGAAGGPRDAAPAAAQKLPSWPIL